MKLEANGIEKTFFRNRGEANFFYALKETDFSLEEGKLTEIVGRSGSGKTTFINILSGLLTPSKGKVLLDGENLFALDDDKRSVLRNRHFGIIPQGQTGLQSLTVLENVLAPALMYGGAENKKDRAMELLNSVGIADLFNVYANELSGGELRRMAIARALINEPQIVIADEPTGDLDDETTELVLKLLRKCAENGASVLMVTHEKDAISYADFVFEMENGVLKRK